MLKALYTLYTKEKNVNDAVHLVLTFRTTCTPVNGNKYKMFSMIAYKIMNHQVL